MPIRHLLDILAFKNKIFGHFDPPGVPKQGGDGGDIPPIIWLYPPIVWMGVHLSVKMEKKVFYSSRKPFFFWSSPEFGEKKCSIC